MDTNSFHNEIHDLSIWIGTHFIKIPKILINLYITDITNQVPTKCTSKMIYPHYNREILKKQEKYSGDNDVKKERKMKEVTILKSLATYKRTLVLA